MEKPVKQVIFAVVVIAATALAAYFLNLLDQIVHGQLYHYNLQFSLDWANPYWNLLRIVQILLCVAAASAAINAALSIREYFGKGPRVKTISQKATVTIQPSTRQVASARPVFRRTSVVEKGYTKPATPQPKPAPMLAPVPMSGSTSSPADKPAETHYSSERSGLIRCLHCGKAFTQPLRMLDFQGDRPRIVNICPFCNEIVTNMPSQTQDD